MVYFIATPIGNLKDISLRALEVLRGCDCVFCEDTRHSLKLLNHYEIKKPLYACHQFNERAAADKLISLAREGKQVAVVTDAGTPVISDPGNVLASAMREAGVEFTLIPGACAFVAALVLSAFPADRFSFVGFLRGKKSEKRALLQEYVGLETGLAGEKRGEYVLLVQGAEKSESPLNSLSVSEHVAHYAKQGMEQKEAFKRVAKDRGVSKSEIYREMITQKEEDS